MEFIMNYMFPPSHEKSNKLGYSVVERTLAQIVDMRDAELLRCIRQFAHEEGITHLCLLDKEFVKTALEREIVRRKEKGRCCIYCGAKIGEEINTNTCDTCKCNKVCDHDKYGFENCGNFINEDAVEVVRCKDCKYAVLTIGENFVVGCDNCGHDILERDKNDFCSQGKRRDGEK